MRVPPLCKVAVNWGRKTGIFAFEHNAFRDHGLTAITTDFGSNPRFKKNTTHRLS